MFYEQMQSVEEEGSEFGDGLCGDGMEKYQDEDRDIDKYSNYMRKKMTSVAGLKMMGDGPTVGLAK